MITTNSAQRASKSGAGKARRIIVLAAATACVAASPLLAAPSAGAASVPIPPDTHCPAGYELLPISSFPSLYDDFLHAQDLNGNQLICSHTLPEAVATTPHAISKYNLPPGYLLYEVSDDSIVR